MKWTVDNYKIVSIDQVNSYMNLNMLLYVVKRNTFKAYWWVKKEKTMSKFIQWES